MLDIIVIGAGPAGASAAIRAADLGARTALVTSADFGGMATNDGPVPIRTLAYAARLLRDSRDLAQYGIQPSEPVVQFDRLIARARQVIRDVRAHSALRERIDALGVTVHERCGMFRFTAPNSIESESGLRLEAEKFIICTGGMSRRLDVPGIQFTSTYTDVYSLTALPESMLVVGGGGTGVQIAAMFNAFGVRVQLFEAGRQILASEDQAIADAVSTELRASGVMVYERFGTITSFEKTPSGVRMNYLSDNEEASAQAEIVLIAAGWVADTTRLNLDVPGVAVDKRGNITVDEFLRTTAPHVFAAGDVIGRVMLVPGAIEDGFVAATNAVQGTAHPVRHRVIPAGSFSHPEYAQVGLTEAKARQGHEVLVAVAPFAAAIRPIIERHTFGFGKLIVDRANGRILGCHVVGNQAVEIAQLAAVAIAAEMPVGDLAGVAISFPTYAEVLSHAAIRAAVKLGLSVTGRAELVRTSRADIDVGPAR